MNGEGIYSMYAFVCCCFCLFVVVVGVVDAKQRTRRVMRLGIWPKNKKTERRINKNKRKEKSLHSVYPNSGGCNKCLVTEVS